MTSTFCLSKDIILGENVTNSVLKFLFSSDETKDERRSSTSSYESTASVDVEKPAGVEEWSPFVGQKNEETLEDGSFWLTDCVVATYSSLEYVLICKELRWVLLRRKTSDGQAFDCLTTKKIETKPAEKQNCYITQCVIFGLGSCRQSELVDSLVVAVGTSLGTVLFFTENGKMLFEESFATNSPISRLSMDYSEDGQLFCVVTESDIFAVNAFSLHATLLQSKSAIAKGEKTAAQLSDTVELEMARFRIEDKSPIKDAIFTGMQQPTAFDQYIKAALDDFNSVVDRAAPNYSTFFVHTHKMFATFSWFPEGEDSHLWGETVTKLANSFIPHFGIRKFLGISQATPRKSALSQTRQKAMNRSTLNDSREIIRMVKGPQPRPWIAIVDNLARVLIMDWKTRHVMRWFKGYRDAQVAFITSSHEGSTVVFLAIFAPRRSLLEVWPLMRGSRVAALSVDPNGMLVDGGTAAVICGKRELRQPAQAYFIDSQGNFFKINVPYHLAFVENNNREHDQLVLGKISSASVFHVDEFLDLYNSLHEASSKRLAFLKVISSCNGPDLRRLVLELRKEESFAEFDEVQRKNFEDILKRVDNVLRAHETLTKSMAERSTEEEELDLPLSTSSSDLIKRHLAVGETPMIDYPPVECLISTIAWTSEHTNILERNIPDVDILQICRIVFEPIFTRAIDIDYFFDQTVQKLPFTEATIVALFSHYILHGKEVIGAKYSAIIDLLETLAKSNHDLLSQLERSAVESPNVSRGLLLSAAIWIVKLRMEEARKREKKDETADEEEEKEWEAFDPTLEYHDCTLLAMHAVWLLSGARNGVTFSKMLTTGAGYFREQIASWVADRQLTIDDFHSAVNDSEQLTELFSLVPKVLEENALFADIGWELMSYWFKSKMDSVVLLQEAVKFIEKIKNNRLRHGVAKLVWEKFLLDTVKALANIIERFARPPKEREAKQTLQIQERHMEIFLDVCCRVLEILRDSVKEMYVISAPAVDHFLETAFAHPPSSVSKVGTGRDSLVHIAVLQQPINYHLALHHLHLLKVYILVLRSGIKIRPQETVFCAIGRRAFFHPLDSHPLIPLEKVDDGTLENRHKFLSKVVETGTEEDRRIAKEMATEWALTVEQIALVEALAHIRHGDDVQGAKELSSVSSPQIGAKLAKILAARLLRLADSKKTLLTATHLRVLQEAASDEQGRVEWDGDWIEAVTSLSGIMKSITLAPEHTALFVKIMSIATRYWGF